MFWIIAGVVIGVVGLGWVYHRYTAQTQSVLDKSATAVNTVIDDVKDQVKK